ncbi:unnamed protein product [Ixodes pacificus]
MRETRALQEEIFIYSSISCWPRTLQLIVKLILENHTPSLVPFSYWYQDVSPSTQVKHMFSRNWGIPCPCLILTNISTDESHSFVQQRKLTAKNTQSTAENKSRNSTPQFLKRKEH